MRRGEGAFVQKGPLSPSQGLILSSQIHDPLMKTQVSGQLGMEGGGEDVPLPHGNGEPVDPGEYLHAGADLFNERRSDEHGFEGRLIRWIAVRCGERAQLQRSREAVDLPPEGVPAQFPK